MQDAILDIQNEMEEDEIRDSNQKVLHRIKSGNLPVKKTSKFDYEDVISQMGYKTVTLQQDSMNKFAVGPVLIAKTKSGSFLYVYKNDEGKCWYEM